MKFSLIELNDLSGEKTKIYSPLIEGDDLTLYEKFIEENIDSHKKEVLNIDDRLEVIGYECGLFEEAFDTKAGKFGENLCTLKDRPKSKLRVFFIEYGNRNLQEEDGIPAIILGGGGEKPKDAKTTQDVPKLNTENRILGEISTTLQKAQKANQFKVNQDGTISPLNRVYNTEEYG